MFLLPMTNTFFEGLRDVILDTYDRSYNIKFSRALGIVSEGNILCWKLPGQWSRFKFLTSFEPIIWYSLITTLFVFGLIVTLKEKISLSQLSDNCWKFFSSIFGHKNMDLEKSFVKIVLSILWLFCMTIMLSGFSGVLLRFFMEPLPSVVIDSWDDLYERKEVKILTFELSFMQTNATNKWSINYFHSNYIPL